MSDTPKTDRYAAKGEDYIQQKVAPASFAGELERENAKLRETIEEMDRIHTDIMDNGPRCTCGDGDEWCQRCGKSIKLSGIASDALKS